MKKKNIIHGIIRAITGFAIVITMIIATANKAYCWGPGGSPQTAIRAMREWGVQESDVFADIQKGYYYDYEIQEIINAGYLGGYVSQIQALGYNVTPAAQPAPAPTPTPESTTPSTTQTPTTNPTPQNQPVKEEITEDESVAGTYIVIKEASVKETYEDGAKELSVLQIGTEVNVLAKTSNKLYKINAKDITGYVPEECLVTKEQYEAAWEETDKKEATCTSKGRVNMKNSLSGEEKAEDIDKLEHKCEWKTVRKASFFSDGEKQYVCKVCKKATKTEIIPATCPFPLWSIIAVIAILLLTVAVVVIVIKRKRNSESE